MIAGVRRSGRRNKSASCRCDLSFSKGIYFPFFEQFTGFTPLVCVFQEKYKQDQERLEAEWRKDQQDAMGDLYRKSGVMCCEF